jgi:hypothetical protein
MDEEKATLKRLSLLPRLFRAPDARKVAPHAAIFLSRAHRNGLIVRLARGSYVNSFLKGMPGVEEVACFLRPPAYVSCEWALNRHGILLQAPRVCTAVTLHPAVGRDRSLTYRGVSIEFSRIAPRLFHGYSLHDGASLATPEKALLDTLYLHRDLPAGDELEMDRIDRDALQDLARQYPATVREKVAALMG